MAHLKPEQKQEWLKTLAAVLTYPQIDRLRDIIDQELDKTERNNDFDTPAWAEKQAYQNGLRDAYNTIKELITL